MRNIEREMSQNLTIAKNLNTPAAKLRELAKTNEPKIRAKIAKNPNTSLDLLIELAGEYLDEIEKNPVFDLILIECPNFLEEIYYKHFHKDNQVCLKEKSLPNIFLKLGVCYPNWEIRAFITNHENTPVNVLEQLASDRHSDVRRGVAENYHTPVTILELLAQDEDENVRYEVATNENTPINILELLAQDEDENVRSQVANHENTPVSVLKQLATERYYDIRLGLAENQNTPLSLLKQLLAGEKDEFIRFTIYQRLYPRRD